MKAALTVAGSDSIGGAGIQADLKAFASLGVHGCSVISCITAQNTMRIAKIEAVSPEMLRSQLDSVLEDITPGAAKTGAIYTPENVKVISETFADREIPLVIDPVLKSTTGSSLAESGFTETLKKELIPICALITPNIYEAEVLTGVRISDTDQASKASELLLSIGASGVLIKGIPDRERVADFLAMSDGSTNVMTSTKLPGEFHGTGCLLSALIAGHIALGEDVCTAVVKSRGDVYDAISSSVALGKGIRLLDPLGHILREATKSPILDELDNLRARIESELRMELIPEVGSNLAYSLQSPESDVDVAGFTGRIVREGRRVKVVGCPRFHASKHVARIVVAASRNDPSIRAAMNIKFNKGNMEACKKSGLSMSSFSRDDEPEGVSSMDWGTTKAIEAFGKVPDAIWDEGGHGKEPMIRILGRNPQDVLDKVARVSRNL